MLNMFLVDMQQISEEQLLRLEILSNVFSKHLKLTSSKLLYRDVKKYRFELPDINESHMKRRPCNVVREN